MILRQTAPRVHCPRCGVRLLRSNLDRHMRTVHAPESVIAHRRLERDIRATLRRDRRRRV